MQAVSHEKGQLVVDSRHVWNTYSVSYDRYAAHFCDSWTRGRFTQPGSYSHTGTANSALETETLRTTTNLYKLEADAVGHCNGPTTGLSAKHPEYSDFAKRLDSFWNWPSLLPHQSPQHMAKEGFFFLGTLDRVRCFYCGLTLRDWEEDDYPYEAHLEWADDCNLFEAVLELEK